MTDRYHTTPDGNIPFTEDEEAARDAEEAAWEADAIPRAAKAKIERLESLVTQRRIRDSVTTDDGKQWMVDQEALIATERGKL